MTRPTATAAALVLLCAGTACVLIGCTTRPGPADTRTVTATVSAPSSTEPSSAKNGDSSSQSAPPSASSAPGTSPAPAARRDPNAPKGQCPYSSLALTVKYDPEGAGAGQRTSWVIFRNTSAASCVLEGTPGVSLVSGGNGKQLGQPAQRGTGGSTVTIPAGGYAGASLYYTFVDKNGGIFNDGNGRDPTCRAARADGYRVYPPHSFRAYFVSATTYGCTTDTKWLSVQAVVPASKVNVKP